jgi:outer membrane biosynthesis protein TonB
MTGSGNMLRITRVPPIWLLAKGPFCASVAISVLLGILLLAGSAHAAVAAESAPEASSLPVAAESAPEASSLPVAAESAPEASSLPVAAESAPETSSPVAPVVETVQETLAPVESAPVAPAPVVEPAPETSPPVKPIEETKEAPVTEPVKEAPEATTGKPTLEGGTEIPSSSPAVVAQDAAPVGSPEDTAAPEVLSVPEGPLTTIPGAFGESQTTSDSSSVDAATLARTIAAQRAESFNRELGGLSSFSTHIDTTGGLDGPSFLSTSTAFVDDLAGGQTSSTGAPAGGRSGGSPGGSSPIGPPPPGPSPSGTFGGAAGGGAGIALSGFPMFAGHLMWGAPVAMRRLRLSFQPWLTAFFVLIPERPG